MKNLSRTALITLFALGGLACSAQTSANSAQLDANMAEKTAPVIKTAERNGNWLVNPRESHIKFSAQQEGTRFEGSFPVFNAYINFFPEALENSRVEVTIPLGQVDASSTDRNSTLPDKVWFSVKKHPLAKFESADFTQTGEGEYLAKGTLTMKGQSREFDLPFSLDMTNGAVMTSQVTLDRTLWGVGEKPWNTNEWVSREVALDIKVTASNPY